MIKLNAKITGEKVHDVGYRVFLLRKALELGIRGFNAYNDFDCEQIIIIQAEGDNQAVQAFKSFAEKKAPEHALVSDRIFEDFDGYVMSISDYMHLIQVEQLNKGIPAIISIDKKQDTTINEIKGVSLKIDQGREEISGEIRYLRDDFRSHFDERLTRIEHELTAIKAKVMP